MSKVITSPVKKYPGTVTLYDPLTIVMAMAFEDARDAAQAIKEELKDVNFTNSDGEEKQFKDITAAKFINALVPGICACVEKWNLTGFPENPTVDNFPGTPKVSIASLVVWLNAQITMLYQEAEEVPNV